MESKLLPLNDTNWLVSVLGEKALLLKPKLDEIPLSVIHESVRIIEAASIPVVVDIIPAYDSIAIVYSRLLGNLDEEIEIISKAVEEKTVETYSSQTCEIPVCYELGLDWREVEEKTGFEKEEVIQKHLSVSYKVAMMGFIPGFLYLSGLKEEIACPRKAEPRTSIPAGSVGIGGNQTGVYSLESPGGWQIIGRTPLSFFDVRKDPPIKVRAGDTIVFKRIPEVQFTNFKKEEV
ncbi:5-oxoprolinase subunit PxpB [Gracilimonas sp.]|uniref:5-oxoprolinase subunit PxpB n=1 Tax=Gracilimonas sp. TaxID=1974203 RepID=UPI0032ECD9F1